MENKNKIRAILMAGIVVMSIALVMPVAMSAPDTVILNPNADGDYKEFPILVDSSHWAATSDATDDTYIKASAVDQRDVQHLENPTFTDSSTVNSVTIYCRAYATGSKGPERIAMMDRLGTTDRATGNIAVTRDTWAEYNSGALTTAPDGQEWTKQKVTDLQAGVKVAALNGGDTIRVSKIWIVVDYTPTGDTTPPGKVTGVTVTTVSSSQLNVSWTKNNEEDLHHYSVYRSETSGFTPNASSFVDNTTDTTNYYLDSGLKASTTYYYRVTAVDTSNNEGEASDEASNTTEAEAQPTPILPDFMVGDQDGQVELFANDDSGGFTSEGVIAGVGSQAWGLASGDFNGDEYLDFIVGDAAGEVELFVGQGSGFSSAGIIADVGGEAYGLTSGDYNGDGDTDFIVGDGLGELELFLNNGTAFNSAGIIGNVSANAWALTSADFDGDTDIDFIVGAADGVLTLFKNDGPETGSFTASEIADIGIEAYGITSGDYDADTDYDFLATADDGEVKLFENNGAGTFTNCGTVISLGSLGYGLESNDFDGDEDIDVLGQNSTHKINLYKGDGTGNFTFDSEVASPGLQPRGLTSGNFVMPDFIVTSISTPIIYANVSNVITATIENGGNENAGAFNTTLYADDVEIETKQVSALNADASTKVSFSWTPTQAGPYTLRVMADSTGAINEFNESNNDKTKEVTAEEAVVPPTPNIIKYGYVVYENGTECNGPVVKVKNLDTSSDEWTAETYDSSNHYELILDSYDKSAGDVLRFTAKDKDPDATQENVTDYTVTQAELDDGGIFGLNLTLKPVGPQNTMHVDNISMWYTTAGPNYKIYTKVKIVDSSDAAVAGAKVYLNTTLPGGTNVSSSGDTLEDGTVEFMYGPTKNGGNYTSTVTKVEKPDWTYVPGDNVETSKTLPVP